MTNKRASSIGILICIILLVLCAWLLAIGLPGCSSAKTSAGGDAETISGIKADLAALRDDFKATAGRDVNTGLSSRGITFIVLGAIACYGFIRWDLNRSNHRITNDAIASIGTVHDDGYRSAR